MKLTVKLVIVLMLAFIALVAVNGCVAIRRQVRAFEQLAQDEAETIGHAMERMVVLARRQGGRDGALEIIRLASQGEHHMELRWVWFDAPPGDPDCPAIPAERLPQVALEEHQPLAAARPDGEDFLYVYWPISVDNQRKGGLELYKPLSELELLKWSLIYRALLQMAVMVLTAAVLTPLLGFSVVGRPLEKLIEKTRRIGTGDLAGPLSLKSRDELGELAESLNRMCDQLAGSQARLRQETAARATAMEELRHADRLRTVGRLASSIAHDVGTPLNVVSGRAGLIASGKLSQEEITESANAIRAEADKMTAAIRRVLDFARRSTSRKVTVDLHQVVRQTWDLLSPLAERRKVELSVLGGEGPLPAKVDAGQLRQVLSNLVLNAVQAMPEGGAVTVELGRKRRRPPEEHDRDEAEGPEAEYYYICVQDEGEGIPESNLPHLFEPFFTTKSTGEGTGLGLSIVEGIVREHGGWIDVASRPGEGSRFCVYLPQEPQP